MSNKDCHNLATILLNKCKDFINATKHEEATNVLKHFDMHFNGRKLPLDIVYHRLIMESELCLRTGNIESGIKAIDNNIHFFRKDDKYKFEILLHRGKLECASTLRFSVNSLSDALAVAETIGDEVLIAEAYSNIAYMFAPRYPALGIYFTRKAEVFYTKSGDKHKLRLELCRRAYQSHLLSTQYIQNENIRARLQLEAERVINTIDTTDFNKFEMRDYLEKKAVILQDEELLKTLLDSYEKVLAPPQKRLLTEQYIAICVNKNLHQKALEMLPSYRQLELEYCGSIIEPHLNELEKLLQSSCPFIFEYARDEKTDDDLNLFDILDQISLDEELWALDGSVMRSCFPMYLHEGLFETVAMPNGGTRLIPCSLSFNRYYRGQSVYYKPCLPSLYRENVTASQQFIERLKYAELHFLIETYPLTELFHNDFYVQFPDKTAQQINLSVDTLALAQHYGIKTELIDLTVDKFVAAFFASTEYDRVTDAYSPIKDTNKNGVFYHYMDTAMPFGLSQVRAVGLQPFSRPGEQSGFVLNVKNGQDFNHMSAKAIKFKHHPKIAEFIFNYTNRSKKLFPASILQDKVNIIKSSNKFSRAAYEYAKELFYQNYSDTELEKYMTYENVAICDEPIVNFTEEEKQQCITDWYNGGQKRTFERIYVRIAYKAPVKFSDVE